MASFQFNFCISFLLIGIITTSTYSENDSFNQNYISLWGSNHFSLVDGGNEVQLLLDQSSGSGIRSKLQFGSGMFLIKMKLPEKKSRGVVTSFYLTSQEDYTSPGAHDELDFEFIGTDGILQTNVFVNDNGGREQRVQLWFDPSTDFHNYSILWNQNIIVFSVDEIPIRVFKNYNGRGVNFISKPMQIEGSIFNGDWAGQIDWSLEPFITHYKNFNINGCPSQNTIDDQCSSPGYYWNGIKELTASQTQQLYNVRKRNMFYDYCTKESDKYPECTF